MASAFRYNLHTTRKCGLPSLSIPQTHAWHLRPIVQRRHVRNIQRKAFQSPNAVQASLGAQQVPGDLPFVFADLPAVFSSFPNGFQLQAPSLPTVFFFLLSHPFVTLSLAIFLYFTIPRLWRLLVKFVIVPTAVVGAGIVVVRNPDSFRSAGIFVAHFTSDHPYITSGVILVALGLLLSPYFLTALLALFIATGVPQLPPQVKNFLPAPVLEVEQGLASFDSVVRGPINVAKGRASEFGSDLSAKGLSFFNSAQSRLLESSQNNDTPGPVERNNHHF